MRYEIIQVIPMNKDTLLTSNHSIKRIVNLTIFIFQKIIDSSNKLSLKKLSCFDAQVSENLCQVRAYKLLFFYDKIENHDFSCFIYKIKQKLEHAKKLLIDFENNNRNWRNGNWTVGEFLNENNFNMTLPRVIFVIFQLYILSEYKLLGKYGISNGINYEKMSIESGVFSKTLIRKFSHRLQKNISYLSVQYLLGQAKKSGEIKKILMESLYKIDEVGRHLMACYEVTKLILEASKNYDRVIRIKVFRNIEGEEEEFSFLLLSKKYSCQYGKFDGCFRGPALTFVGVCNPNTHESREEYIERFIKAGFEDIILLNMAQHPQFSGRLLKEYKINPYKTVRGLKSSCANDYVKKSESSFLVHKTYACKLGCSIENKSLFFLTHVYFSEETENIN